MSSPTEDVVLVVPDLTRRENPHELRSRLTAEHADPVRSEVDDGEFRNDPVTVSIVHPERATQIATLREALLSRGIHELILEGCCLREW